MRSKKTMVRFWLCRTFHMKCVALAVVTLCPGSVLAAGPPASPTAPAAFTPAPSPPTWDRKLAGQFIMSLAYDRSGCVWAGTEGNFVWRFDPHIADAAKAWTQFTTHDGLGDDNGYAIACDHQGRIWVGTNHGVSVYNGKTWKNYDQVTGPLGGHVVAIAVSPKSGDVWMATEIGLATYRPKSDDWKYYVVRAGISLSNATGLTFDIAGNILVGLQTDGVAVGDASSGFERWTHIAGPKAYSGGPSGNGLPSRQINCLLTTADGNIWAGTHDGLAFSSNGGAAWRYVRGADYADKFAGLFRNRPFSPALCGFQLLRADAGARPIEDARYVSAAAAPPANDQFGVHIECSGGSAQLAPVVVDRAHSGSRRTPMAIDLTRADHPGPEDLYQSERKGEFSYTLTGLTAGSALVLRLHFAEFEYKGPGQRRFSVFVNDKLALRDFDIFAAAGGRLTALTRSLPVSPDAGGKIMIRFTGNPAASAVPAHTAPAPGHLMTEDNVTCLAGSDDGRIYAGHWLTGAEIYDPKTQTFSPFGAETESSGMDENKHHRRRADFIANLLPASGGMVLSGTYGLGLRIDGQTADAPALAAALASQGHTAAPNDLDSVLPSEAIPPSSKDIAALDASVTAGGLAGLMPGEGAYLGADWATRGDWVGRYGSKYAILCATASPFSHEMTNDFGYSCDGDIGPARNPFDGMRRWITWLRSNDPRVLYDPVVATRREAEWDDHGEEYPRSQEGPDLWLTVSVPAGVHRLAAYFVNPNGHSGAARNRQYVVDLLPWRVDMQDSLNLGAIGSARIGQFWNGVYQVFVVGGPGKFYLHVSRNNSFNTMVSGVLLDKLLGPPTAYETKCPGLHSVYFLTKKYDAYLAPPEAGSDSAKVPKGTDAIRKLWSDIDRAAGKRLLAPHVAADRVLCYRALAAAPGCDPALLAWWRRSLPMVTDEDRAAFKKGMEDMYADEIKLVPSLNRTDL